MKTDLRTIRNILIFFLVIALFYLLKVLSSIVIPLILAFFIALLLFPIVSFLRSKKVPGILALILSVASAIWLMVLAGEAFSISIAQLYKERGELERLMEAKLKEYDVQVDQVLDYIETEALSLDLSGTLAQVGTEVTSILGSSFMVLIYLIVILIGLLKYKSFLAKLEKESNIEWIAVFEEIRTAFSVYIRVKFLISLGTGITFGLTCWFFGIGFPLFWGFLAFSLNFIPTFGSLGATLLLIIFGFLYLPLSTLLIFGGILIGLQMVFGNVLEPVFLDRKLSINTLTILVGLVFWGYILGIVGTLLAVPLLVLVKIILNKSATGKLWARIIES